MVHFVNSLCSCLIVYVSITRGGLVVARGLEYVTSRAKAS
jgi:hypothetical protein